MVSPTEGVSRNRRSKRRTIVAIALLAVLWLVAMLSRHTIWAHWWGYKLQTSNNAVQRLNYLMRLGGLGEASVPVATKLIRSNDVELRSFGLFLLSRVDTQAATAHLRGAIHDSDRDIRRSALQAYARRAGPDVAGTLAELMNDDRADVALGSTVQLAITRRDEAIPILIEAVRAHPSVGVRVQAIQSLAMVTAHEAIDALIDRLNDTTTHVGRTATEESAARALKAAATAGSLPDDIAPTDDVVEPVHVVGNEAAKALRIITGQSFGYRSDDEAAKASAIASWRQWQASQASPKD